MRSELQDDRLLRKDGEVAGQGHRRYGQHTEEIFTSLPGVPPEEFPELRAQGVIV